ncbi:MAG TPA: DUF4416 family protein [Moorella mulderi]|nr:DUF4416 family protein [Moorella mulderi]
MGKIREVLPVKIFCGLLYREEAVRIRAQRCLEEHWGEVDLEAGPFPFSFTDYYFQEMGGDLKKYFLGFRDLKSPEDSCLWKLFTNSLEEKFSRDGRRAVNLDPGYIDSAKVVLFSTKNFYHRIYLGKGIYGEVTLYYSKGEYRCFPWTYPDYRTPEYINFFTKLRELYHQQLRALKRS